MKTRLLGLLVGLFVLLNAAPAVGQGSFKGYMFGDAYYLASHDDGVNEDTDDAIEGANGLWFRRIYLTFDWTFNDAWSARLRTEMGSPGDFKTASSLVPFAKDAYVRWKNGNHQITLGISGTPTWAVIEDFWGYRSVEKTLLDLQRIASSRDVGVAFKGSLDQAKKFRYNLMLGNGNSVRNENNEGKKVLLSLGFSRMTTSSSKAMWIMTTGPARPTGLRRRVSSAFRRKKDASARSTSTRAGTREKTKTASS